MIELILSWRYFLRRKISALACAAVALSVFIVIVVLGVMTGLVEDFKQKNHRFVGDCVIRTESLTGFPYAGEFIQQLAGQANIAAAAESVYGVGLMTVGSSWNSGIEYLGLDPAQYGNVTGFNQTIRYHAANPDKVFEPPYDPGLPGCVLGIDLVSMRRQDTGKHIEDEQPWKLKLLISSFPLTPKGALARADIDSVSSMEFYYSDHSFSGLVKPDGQMIYLPIDRARQLSGMDAPIARSSAIHIRFKDGVSLRDGVEQISRLWDGFVKSKQGQPYGELLSSVQVRSWKQDRREAIAPMEKEQLMLVFLFCLLAVITVFIIFVVFYMIIGHKTRDLGILKSVGLSRPRIVSVFLYFAALIGLIGSSAGIAAGCLFLYKINDLEQWLFAKFGWQLWNRAVYAIDLIPNDIRPALLAVVGFAAVAACLLGALIPGLGAAFKSPVKTLQVAQV